MLGCVEVLVRIVTEQTKAMKKVKSYLATQVIRSRKSGRGYVCIFNSFLILACGGILQKHEDEVHFKNPFSLGKKINASSCSKHRVCNTMCLTCKKGFFSRDIITKHEQNVVKSGLNIIPAWDVKMRGIVKVILRNPRRPYMCGIVV